MPDFAERRRLSFGSVADQYDRARPRYPKALINDVLRYARDPRVFLEVGAGTGIATGQFAPHAEQLVALEPDPAMAAIAIGRGFVTGAGIPVEIRQTTFEDAALPAGEFGLLISGTAWHWVNPERRYALAAHALASGGALAAFWNRPQWNECPIRPGLDAAYAAIEDAFQEGDQMRPADPVDVEAEAEWREELSGQLEFTDLSVRRHRWSRRYTSQQYVDLLGTHSSHNLLPEDAKARLFAGITEAIDANGGAFELTYEALLCLARRT